MTCGNHNSYISRKKRLNVLNKENINLMSFEMTKIFNYINKRIRLCYHYANSGGKRKEKRYHHQVKNASFYFPN